MRFLVLMSETDHFDRWGAADEPARQAVFDSLRSFMAAVEERGAVLGGEALGGPDGARTLHPGTADRPVTEGPFAETVEQLGGFYLVELPDLDTAVDLCRLLPPEYTIELRPVVDPTW